MTLGIIAIIFETLSFLVGVPTALAIDGRSWKFPSLNRLVNICIAVALISGLVIMTYYGLWDGAAG